MGTTLGYHTSHNGCTTPLAGLSLSSVDVTLILICTISTVRRHIVTDTGAAGFNRTVEDLANGVRKSVGFRFRDSCCATTRSNPRQEERFIRIDVSHTGHHGLIEQKRFDGRLPFPAGCEEVLAGHFQRVESQSLQSGMDLILGQQEQFPEFTNIPEIDIGPFIIERQDHVGMWVRSEAKLLLGRQG